MKRVAGRVAVSFPSMTEEQGKSPDPRVEQALMVTIAGVAAGTCATPANL